MTSKLFALPLVRTVRRATTAQAIGTLAIVEGDAKGDRRGKLDSCPASGVMFGSLGQVARNDESVTPGERKVFANVCVKSEYNRKLFRYLLNR